MPKCWIGDQSTAKFGMCPNSLFVQGCIYFKWSKPRHCGYVTSHKSDHKFPTTCICYISFSVRYFFQILFKKIPGFWAIFVWTGALYTTQTCFKTDGFPYCAPLFLAAQLHPQLQVGTLSPPVSIVSRFKCLQNSQLCQTGTQRILSS